MRFVAFLRAINVTGRHVKMERLRGVFGSLGFENVTTFIASGNVIFDAKDEPCIRAIDAALEAELGFEVPTFLRSASELSSVVDANPFPGATELEVSFLLTQPDPGAVLQLEGATSGTDLLKVIGREVYWSHEGNTQESEHSEARVMRLLNMPTTRRSFRTVHRIADEFL